MRSVIRILNAKNAHLTEILRQIVEVQGDGAVNGTDVRKWCRLFMESRTKVHDEERNGSE